MHAKFGEAIGAKFLNQQKFVKYIDRKNFKSFFFILNLIAFIFLFPYRKCDIIHTDEINILAVIVKIFSFNRIKLSCTQDAYTLNKYFDESWKNINRKLIKRLYDKYNLIMCIGDIQYELATKMFPNNSKEIKKSFNGVRDERVESLKSIKYNAKANQVVSIVHCKTQDRFFTKGVDLMLATFNELFKVNPKLSYNILGVYNPDVIRKHKEKFPHYPWQCINFLGRVMDFNEVLANSKFCLHFSRIEPWGIAVNETGLAGIPTFISTNVGAKTSFSEQSIIDNFIVDTNNFDQTVETIQRFIDLTEKEKLEYSFKFKECSKDFTEANALKHFRENYFEYFGGKQSNSLINEGA